MITVFGSLVGSEEIEKVSACMKSQWMGFGKTVEEFEIIKRRFHTTPPTPPDKPIALILFLITGYYIYQHTPREPPSSHSPFGLY